MASGRATLRSPRIRCRPACPSISTGVRVNRSIARSSAGSDTPSTAAACRRAPACRGCARSPVTWACPSCRSSRPTSCSRADGYLVSQVGLGTTVAPDPPRPVRRKTAPGEPPAADAGPDTVGSRRIAAGDQPLGPGPAAASLRITRATGRRGPHPPTRPLVVAASPPRPAADRCRPATGDDGRRPRSRLAALDAGHPFRPEPRRRPGRRPAHRDRRDPGRHRRRGAHLARPRPDLRGRRHLPGRPAGRAGRHGSPDRRPRCQRRGPATRVRRASGST